MYNYIKALHIIFIVTWFSGMFYIVRLFIYNREAQDKEPATKKVLQEQFTIMIKRLWFGITWPSAALTLIFGTWMAILYNALPSWLIVKLAFVICLFAYHISLHRIYSRQMAGDFRISSQKLRIWNEVATILLIAIVMLVVVKQEMSLAWGLGGLVLVIFLLMSAIKIYKNIRSRKS
ncbi:MAG TPA: CopD family protein [Flavitalea sp.]|nr:CopD family protein [Flavitalea sp.]